VECDFAFLCDYAEQERKLHAIGIGWDTIYAHGVPFTHPVTCFVARLRGVIDDQGTKTVSLHVIDADGVNVIPVAEQQLPFVVAPGQLVSTANLVFQLQGMQFAKFGEYAVQLRVHGVQVAEVPFSVAQLQPTS
jgi:hypothetical protein